MTTFDFCFGKWGPNDDQPFFKKKARKLKNGRFSVFFTRNSDLFMSYFSFSRELRSKALILIKKNIKIDLSTKKCVFQFPRIFFKCMMKSVVTKVKNCHSPYGVSITRFLFFNSNKGSQRCIEFFEAVQRVERCAGYMEFERVVGMANANNQIW